MSSVTITTNTCKLRLFQGNSFLNIIYFYKIIKGKCSCITKTNKKYTSFRFENMNTAYFKLQVKI